MAEIEFLNSVRVLVRRRQRLRDKHMAEITGIKYPWSLKLGKVGRSKKKKNT